MLRSREIAFNPTIDTQSSAPYHTLPSTGVLKAHHCVFKIPMKRGILSYTNAYGEIEQKVVDEDYVLDPTIGDIDIEYTYVLQCWEAYRFGDKDWGVYTKAQPCVVQREEVNNLNHCKLPYNGLSRLMLLNNPKPIPYRLLPVIILEKRWKPNWLVISLQDSAVLREPVDNSPAIVGAPIPQYLPLSKLLRSMNSSGLPPSMIIS